MTARPLIARGNWPLAGACLVVLVLLVAFTVQSIRIGRAEERVRDARLAERNAVAQADTTRAALTRAELRAAGYPDSLRVLERQAVQAQAERDGLDRVLKRVTVASAALTARVQRLEALAVPSSGSTTDSATGTRTETFAVRQAPYTVDALVTLPVAPARATLDVQVALDPITLYPRVQCDARTDAQGTRGATVLLDSVPAWLVADVQRAQVSPDVCSPAPATRAPGFWQRARTAAKWATIGAGAALTARAVLAR